MEKYSPCILSKPGIAAEVLPFYGYILEWKFVMTNLSKSTYSLWYEHSMMFQKLNAAYPAIVVQFSKFDHRVTE
jgi:hypothetical protein